MDNREFIFKAVVVILGSGLIGFALKFTTYFNHWYWLPTYPNLLDAFFICIAALMLLYLGLTKKIGGELIEA